MNEKSTRVPGQYIEDWAFSETELKNPTGCNAFQEFVGKPEGYEVGVLVQRNGIATNRWADGTVGITKAQTLAVASVETLLDHERCFALDAWREVVTDKTGKFIRFAVPSDFIPIIRAEVHEDTSGDITPFDALAWFEQADREEILALAECGWGGEYAADAVAAWTSEIDPHLSFALDDNDGFECHVREEDALNWLKEHRPNIFKKVVNA